MRFLNCELNWISYVLYLWICFDEDIIFRWQNELFFPSCLYNCLTDIQDLLFSHFATLWVSATFVDKNAEAGEERSPRHGSLHASACPDPTPAHGRQEAMSSEFWMPCALSLCPLQGRTNQSTCVACSLITSCSGVKNRHQHLNGLVSLLLKSSELTWLNVKIPFWIQTPWLWFKPTEINFLFNF